MAEFETLRQELRGLDGDLYLCHLFAPAAKRDALLTLYHLYADVARVPASVTEQMIGAIRLQWWRDLLDAVEAGETLGTPIGEALLLCHLDRMAVLPLIDGREAALSQKARNLQEIENEAAIVGPAFLSLSVEIMQAKAPNSLLTSAGTGFELMRLVPHEGHAVAARARSLLQAACKEFNQLPRKQRKQLLAIFLPIGLAKRHADHFPQNKGLLRYQFSILKMAFLGKL